MYCFIRNRGAVLALLLSGGALLSGADKSGYTFANPVPAAELRELSTDRPDQTESPYTVDAGHFQVESDLVNYTRDRDGNIRTTDLSLAALNLKVGLTNR